jgi:glycosyltransferase involved in cell wall biosynthesis
MRIGFDAKRAFHNQTGLGHYSRTLLNSLSTYYPQNDYVLFSPKHSQYFSFSDPCFQTVFPTGIYSGLLSSYWRSRGMVNDLKKYKLDIYHGLSHELPVGIRKTGVRSVVTMHDLIFERYPNQYKAFDKLSYRFKFRYACKNADAIIAISKQTRKDLIELYDADPAKIHVCYQSCNPAFSVLVDDAEKKRVRDLYNLPASYFLYVGSVIERKNLLGVCKAYALIRKNTEMPLVVIGKGGPYLQQVKKFIESEKLNDRIIFLSEHPNAQANAGFQTAADFPAIYQQAAAMIYPSYYEGFGIPVIEALWSGIPVITSYTSCLPEAGGPGAFYVDPSSPKQIAEKINTILFDSKTVKEQLSLYQSHLANFTPEATVSAVMDVYRKVLKG